MTSQFDATTKAKAEAHAASKYKSREGRAICRNNYIEGRNSCKESLVALSLAVEAFESFLKLSERRNDAVLVVNEPSLRYAIQKWNDAKSITKANGDYPLTEKETRDEEK